MKSDFMVGGSSKDDAVEARFGVSKFDVMGAACTAYDEAAGQLSGSRSSREFVAVLSERFAKLMPETVQGGAHA